MVAPEEGVPCICILHALLPFLKESAKLGVVRGFERPLLTVKVVNFQMVERENHLEFFLIRVRVADTVVQGGRGHFADCHIACDSSGLDQLFEILVNSRTVCVEASAVADRVILVFIRLGNQVDNVEAESGNTLGLPEAQHLGQLCSDSRVLPVEIGLGDVEEVQIIFAQRRNIFPRIAAEL